MPALSPGVFLLPLFVFVLGCMSGNFAAAFLAPNAGGAVASQRVKSSART